MFNYIYFDSVDISVFLLQNFDIVYYLFYTINVFCVHKSYTIQLDVLYYINVYDVKSYRVSIALETWYIKVIVRLIMIIVCYVVMSEPHEESK